jgi:hypothetical protein
MYSLFQLLYAVVFPTCLSAVRVFALLVDAISDDQCIAHPFLSPLQVSIDEFVSYFTDRVKQALAERKRKRSEKALVMLRKTFAGAMSKGMLCCCYPGVWSGCYTDNCMNSTVWERASHAGPVASDMSKSTLADPYYRNES